MYKRTENLYKPTENVYKRTRKVTHDAEKMRGKAELFARAGVVKVDVPVPRAWRLDPQLAFWNGNGPIGVCFRSWYQVRRHIHLRIIKEFISTHRYTMYANRDCLLEDVVEFFHILCSLVHVAVQCRGAFWSQAVDLLGWGSVPRLPSGK